MEDNTKISSLLRMIDVRIRMDLDERNEEFQLTSMQVRILGFLIEHDDREINPRDLEHYFRISKPTVTGVLKRLEEKGYLHYEPSGKDLRYKQIVLDDKAYQCAKQLHARFEAMERKLYQGLSDEELELTTFQKKRRLCNETVASRIERIQGILDQSTAVHDR